MKPLAATTTITTRLMSRSGKHQFEISKCKEIWIRTQSQNVYLFFRSLPIAVMTPDHLVHSKYGRKRAHFVRVARWCQYLYCHQNPLRHLTDVYVQENLVSQKRWWASNDGSSANCAKESCPMRRVLAWVSISSCKNKTTGRTIVPNHSYSKQIASLQCYK